MCQRCIPDRDSLPMDDARSRPGAGVDTRLGNRIVIAVVAKHLRAAGSRVRIADAAAVILRIAAFGGDAQETPFWT